MFNTADKPTCGLSISDRSIEVLKLDEKRNVETFARASLEPGVVVNGEVLKKKKLKRILEKLFQEADLSAPKLVLGLPESKVFVDYFELSENLEGEKLRKAVSKHAKNNVPLEQNKVYWDFIKKKEAQKTRIVYVAVLKDVVRSYLDVLEELEAELKIVGIEAIALRRALLSSNQKGAVAIADIGARTTNLSFFSDEKLLSLTISEEVTGDLLDKAIKEKLGVKLERARELRETRGLTGEGEDGEKVKSILEEELDRLILGIKRAFEHYQKDLGMEIEKLVLAGGCSLIPGLFEYLQEKLEVKLEIGDPLKNIKAGKPFEEKQDPILFAPVIGLALTDFDKSENKIDFLQVRRQELEARAKKRGEGEAESWLTKLRSSTMFAVVLFVIGVLVLGFVLYAYVYKARSPSSGSDQTESLPAATSTRAEPDQKEATSTEKSGSGEEEAIEDTKPATTSTADTEVEEVEIDSPDVGWLNVRQGPGSEHNRLTTVDHGEVFSVLKESEDWYKIELSNGQVGWISSSYTKPVED